eukprot:scaffold137_cov156-Skeletonema_menzelii.AAC.10
MAPLTDAAIWDIAETRNNSDQWFHAEITFRNECIQNKFHYPPPGEAEKDRSRRQCARVKMKRQMIRRKLLLHYFFVDNAQTEWDVPWIKFAARQKVVI